MKTTGNNLYERVKEYILRQKMISPQDSVIAGVSGGADSLCLLQILLTLSREWGFFLQVVHVHHGLRESADGDLEFVEDVCRREKVPCRSVMADAAAMAARWGTGVEEAGRRLRYAAFEEMCGSLEAERGRPCRIAVAHHREDQAETVLFHLCRGTDIRGARGMAPVSGRVIRPLLAESRAQIEDFLTGRGLSWRVDETNADTSYTRNYLRAEILPRLAEGVNPSAAEHLARFAGVCAETERFLAALTEGALDRCLIKLPDRPDRPEAPGGERKEKEGEGFFANKTEKRPDETPVISLDALKREDPFMQDRVLYRCLAASAGGSRDLAAVHVQAMRDLSRGQGSGSLSLPGRVTLVRSGGALFFFRDGQGEGRRGDRSPAPEPERSQPTPAPEEDPIRKLRQVGTACPLSEADYLCRVFAFDGDLAAIPRKQYTKWFDYDKIGMFPVFRTRRPGDRIRILTGGPDGETTGKKVAKIMLDGKIPARIRAEVVLPFCGTEALWIPGLRMGEGYRVTPGTRRVLEICWTGGREPEKEEEGGIHGQPY